MKQLCQLILCQIGSDYAQASGVVCPAFSHLILSRHQIKLLPGTIRHAENSFGPKHRTAAGFSGQCLQDLLQLFFCVLMGGFFAPAGKDLVCMMMVVMVMAAMFMIVVLMIVMAVLMVMMLMIMVAVLMIVYIFQL